MKFLDILSALGPSDYKAVEKFLRSPYFKASDQYLTFFRFLAKHHAGFKLSRAEVQTAFIRCFGADDFSETKLYNVVSGLSQQLEQYLVVQMVLENSGRETGGVYDCLLTRALDERNSGAYFRKKASDLLEVMQAIPVKNIDDYLDIYHLHQQIYFNPDTPKFGHFATHLPQASEQLDLHYYHAKLRLAAEMKARERILQTRYDIALLEPVLASSESIASWEQHPSLVIYCQVIRLYLGGLDQTTFHELLIRFKSRFNQFPKAEQQSMVRHLINGGISLVARGAAVEPDLLALYKLAIDDNMLLDGNRITPQSFVNIANLAGLCAEFQWGDGFIERFAPHLEQGARQAAVNLARAGLFYHQKNLDDAQLHLTANIFTIAPFDLLSRNLLLKIAFDRFLQDNNSFGFLQAHMKAYEHYVQMKPFTADKKTAEMNLIKFARRMGTIRLEQGRLTSRTKQELRERLAQTQPIVSKKWLESKIDDL